MFSKNKVLKSFILKYRQILSNISYLSILQLFNVLFPLITYTYLIRILGKEIYGKVVFAQTILTFFSILIDFGFNISATKDVAVFKNDKGKLNEIVSSIFILKGILFLLGFLLLLLLVYLVPRFKEDRLLYLLFYGICFNEFLFPRWFFQGIEKMKFITLINISIRTSFLFLIFFLVSKKSDYLYIPLSYSLGALMGGIISLYFVFIKQGISFKFQGKNVLNVYINNSVVFFFSSGMVHIKEKTNAIIIGSFVGFQELAFYDFAIKIIDVLKLPFAIFRDAVFPRVMQLKSIDPIKKIIKYGILIAFLLYLFVILFGKYFAQILGKQELMGAEKLFYVMGLYFPFTCLAMYSGMGLIAFSKKKQFSNSIIVSTVIYTVLLCLYLFFFENANIYILIAIYLVSLLIESIMRYFYLTNSKK